MATTEKVFKFKNKNNKGIISIIHEPIGRLIFIEKMLIGKKNVLQAYMYSHKEDFKKIRKEAIKDGRLLAKKLSSK